MNRHLNASLLSVVFFASLGTAACTAETSEENAPSAATTQSPAELLAGEGGTQTAPISGYATAQTITSGKASLVVDGASYDLLSYSFGISNHNPALSGGVDQGAGKAVLADLHVMVRPSANEAVLRRAILSGESVANARIVLYPTVSAGSPKAPKPIELAVFQNAFVNAVATGGGGDSTVESYALAVTNVTLSYAGARVAYDMRRGVFESDGACADDGVLPAYTQANAGEAAKYPLVAGAVRVDSVAVAVSNPNGATTAGKAQLDGISLAGSLEKGGVCGFYYSAKGKVAAAAKIGIAGEVGIKNPKAFESTSWTACLSGVESVQITSSGDGAPVQVLQLQAGGVLRTDRTYDAKSGRLNESSSGWSFVNNRPASTCAAVEL